MLSLLLLVTILINCTNPDDDDPKPNIDLEASDITFSVVKTDDFNGTVTLTGIVKNIADDFTSGEGQQVIYLYEKSLGTPSNQSGNLVASRSFENLSAGETLEVSFSRTWSSSNEFPPEYILVIGYDPDLYIDSNLNNDDTNQANDKITVSGYDINAIF
ncbi:hypothetical protein JBL43_03155 [Aureibaculum sp. A20]|uniref:CARDB domain-containing protein n=1 Tax=Aureibaculum flavum TaxID=2795986 RepID=A0ABS0WMP1_9FLAO|nr:hypothetical protein [Aureibaculum flavum]MBJ2173217.1 hypothetical protein [Aureibaculum flavum]